MKTNFSNLRQEAEKKIRKEEIDISHLTEEEIKNMIHNQEVLQVELEMQNEELRTANEELESMRKQYSDLYELAPTGYISLDKKYIIQKVNATFSVMTGFSRKSILQKPLSNFIQPEFQDSLHIALRQLGKTSKKQQVELQLKNQRGITLWVNLDFISRGNGQSFLVAVSNINKQKEAEKKIKESEEKFRAIFDNVNDAVGLHKITENGISNFLEVNKTAQNMLGYSEDELRQMTPFDIINEQIQQDYDLLFQQLKQKGVLHFEASNRTKSGQMIPVETVVKLFEMDGQLYMTSVVRDISERIKAQNALKESEERYKLLSNLTFEGIVIHDKGIAIDANESFARIFGYTLTEIIGQNIVNLLIEKKDHPVIAGKMAQSQARPYEVTARRKNGSAFPLEIVARNIHYNGETMRVAAVRDITEQKKNREVIERANTHLTKLNKKLKFEKNKAQHYLDIAGVMFIALDRNGTVLLANKKAAEVLECPEQEIVGKNWFEHFIPQKRCEKVKEIFGKITNNNIDQVEFVTSEVVTQNQNIRTIEWHNSVLFNDKNETIGLLSSGEDVTERKKAEEALRRSEAKFKSIFQFSNIGIALGNPQGNLIEVNNELCHLLGYSRAELLQMNFADFTYPDDVEIEMQFFEQLITNQKDSYRLQKRYVNKHGKVLWVDLAVAGRRDPNDKIDLFIGMVLDITGQKEAELQLQENQKELQELNATKDKFFSIIAHDLKGPFGSIMGLSELLLRNLEKFTPEKSKMFIKGIYDSTQNTYKLLENLLEWARSQTGKIQFSPDNLVLETLVIHLIDIAQNQAENKKIEIGYTINEGIVAFADKNMVNTVLRNLLSNAIKFTPESGKVTIKALIRNEKEILVSVTDTGIGIPQHRIDELFEISEKKSTYGTNREKGTGLGLILCKDFVERNDGKIWVESTESKGSTFFFTLPRAL